MELSIIIALYNSEKTISPVIEEVQEELNRIHMEDYEIILINDCSSDNVLTIAKELALKNKRIKIIDLAKNVGQTSAVMMGFRFASGNYIIDMDDDFQTPGNEIGKLIETLEKEDLDVVFARYPHQKHTLFREFGSHANYKMAEYLAGKPKGLHTNGFYIMRKFVCDEIIHYNNNYPYIFGIIFSITNRVGNVDISHRERLHGKSGHNLRKLLSLWLNGFLSFSIKPLRISSLIGFISSGAALVATIWITISRLMNPDSPLGYASTMVTILFFAGVQLISIGLLGEYLGRLYISSSNLPKAVIRSVFNMDKEDNNAYENKNNKGL